MYHGRTVWEEVIRIPLFITGPGVAARVAEHAASLVDVPPTIAEMTGLSPSAGWPGSSLLSLEADRPVFLFESRDRPLSTLAIIEGARKVVGFEDTEKLRGGEPLAAFDLDADPEEQRDVLESGQTWPARLLRRWEEEAVERMRPRVGPRPAILDPARAEQLRAMGYLSE